MASATARLARLRVPLGFALAAIVFLVAHPTRASLAWGAAIVAIGEAIRIWAAGHVEKGREVTSSGPYRWVRHPLYIGSAVIGAGLAVVCHSLVAAVVVFSYLSVTLTAAIRTEEAWLRASFGDQYRQYCEGHTVARRFSASRAIRNREQRAMGGLVLGLLLLALKMT